MKKIKKTLTGIIAGISLLGMVGCGSLQKLATEPVNRSVVIQRKASIDQIVESVYCLRAKATYEIEVGDDKTETTSTGYGSAFAYRRVLGDTYLITNQHVLGKKEFSKLVIEQGIDDQGKPVLKMSFKKFKRKSLELTIVDSYADKNKKDDIPLDYIFESENPDIAVLRTKREIKNSQISRLSQGIKFLGGFYFGDSNTLRYGEEARLIGYPMARFLFVSEGIIGNPGKKYPKGQPIETSNVLLDVTANPGNSGGPFFVKRGNDYYWMGIVESCYFNSWGDNSGIASAIKVNDVRKLADKAILDDRKKK